MKDAFYSKTKEFCTAGCGRSYAEATKDGKPTPKQLMALKVMVINFMNDIRSILFMSRLGKGFFQLNKIERKVYEA